MSGLALIVSFVDKKQCRIKDKARRTMAIGDLYKNTSLTLKSVFVNLYTFGGSLGNYRDSAPIFQTPFSKNASILWRWALLMRLEWESLWTRYVIFATENVKYSGTILNFHEFG